MSTEENKVAVRSVCEDVINTGNLSLVDVTGMVISRFAGDKVVEDWEIFDQMGMLQQLGVVPTTGQAEG